MYITQRHFPRSIDVLSIRTKYVLGMVEFPTKRYKKMFACVCYVFTHIFLFS